MSLEQWSYLAQIITSVLTLVGVLVSLGMSIRALREVQFDRRLRQRPHLEFEPGGFRIPIAFVKAGKTVPGMNPEVVASLFPSLPDDSESIRPKHSRGPDGRYHWIEYGKLVNHGAGPALETTITWNPMELRIGSDTFKIDDSKRSEPRYSPDLNTMVPSPRNIGAGLQSTLYWLPTFIEKDTDKKVFEATGLIRIRCRDVFGASVERTQGFYVSTGYAEPSPYVHITFLESVEPLPLSPAA